MEAGFCVSALEEALRQTCPEISNTDQGPQFTSEDVVGPLERAGIRISRDERGRHPRHHLCGATVANARAGLVRFFPFYNEERVHQSLDYRTSAQVYLQGPCLAGATV